MAVVVRGDEVRLELLPLRQNISAVSEAVGAFGGREGVEQRGHGVAELVDGSNGSLVLQRLALGEHLSTGLRSGP